MSPPSRGHSKEGVYAGRRILVIGASGFIGRWVSAALAGQGALVSALVRDPAKVPTEIGEASGISLVPGDVERRTELADSIAEVMADLRPSVTFNLVGYGVRPGQDDPGTAERLNTDFVGRLMKVAADVRDDDWPGNAVVHAGSQAEYGPLTQLEESQDPEPVSLYGRTKLAGTRLAARCARDTGLPAVVARVFNVYGPGEPAHRLLPTLIRRAADEDPIDLTSCVQERDFVFVRDVADAMLRLGAASPLQGEPVNIATGRPIPLRELVLSAAQQLQISPERLRFGALPDRPLEVPSPAVSARRLRELTGWSPATSLEVGIRETVANARQSMSAEQR